MFENRQEAGKKLASLLLSEKNLQNAIVVSLPRGGVVVGDVIAKVLDIPHKALVVKKIGAPNNPELAIGATGSDGIVYWDERIVDSLEINETEKKELLNKTISTIKQKEKDLGLKLPNVHGKIALIVDDGVATGATAIVASLILKKLGSNKNILVTPVISRNTKQAISKYFNRIITAELPRDFRALSQFYQEFPQVEDGEVRKLLNK